MATNYEYIALNNIQSGQYFQFATGAAINQVVIKERNNVLYMNIITGKCRHVKGFGATCGIKKTCMLKYVKLLDGVFEKYYNTRRDIEDLPF